MGKRPWGEEAPSQERSDEKATGGAALLSVVVVFSMQLLPVIPYRVLSHTVPG